MKRSSPTARIMDGRTRRSAEIAGALAAYMYAAARIDAPDGMTVKQIIKRVDADTDKVKNWAAYRVFKAAAEKYPQQMMGLEICLQSRLMSGVLRGARAAAFVQGKRVFVAYQGTDDMEWQDNGEGMFLRSTRLQRLAVKYFDVAVQRMGWNSLHMITVCGHSKGGNKAQFVMLDSDYAELISTCWSFDGQGFSPEAIEYYKKELGRRYHTRRSRMYSVCGENDYVNGLGKKIIPAGNTYYVETPSATAKKFMSNHVVQSLWEKNGKEYTGSLNSETTRGDMCRFSGRLSKSIMVLPVDERRDVSMTVTRIIENLDGERVGATERSSNEAVRALISAIPGAMTSIFLSVEGRRLAVSYADAFTTRNEKRRGKWTLRLKNAALYVLLTLASLLLAIPTAAVWLFSALKRKIKSRKD